MPLPPSFAKDGFVTFDKARTRMKVRGHQLKPLLIGTEGESNTGKTEFILSCPDPGVIICVDRGIDGVLDNPNPPGARRSNWGFKVVAVPPNLTAAQATYSEYFNDIRASFYGALANPDTVTVAVDGDSDFWELHRLAAFGRLVGVMPIRYGDVYAQRRAITAKAWDSGKIVIGTNKVKDEYVTVYAADGTSLKESDGTDKRKKTGNKERQGFPDQDYLWQIQLRHLYQSPTPITAGPRQGQMFPGKWGIRILKCKVRPELQGEELWSERCNFRGLVELVYPNVPLEQWGL